MLRSVFFLTVTGGKCRNHTCACLKKKKFTVQSTSNNAITLNE